MGFVKAAAIIMGVLILVGTGVIAVTIVKRMSGVSAPGNVTVVLDEPEGTRVGGIAALPDRLAVLLQGAGPDRIILIDPHSGAKAGAVTLAR
jgi:hypothetical protein